MRNGRTLASQNASQLRIRPLTEQTRAPHRVGMTPCGDPVDTQCQLSGCVMHHRHSPGLRRRPRPRAAADVTWRAWPTEVVQGHTISSNNFFMFYYMLTGVRLCQLLLGLLILGVLPREPRNPDHRRRTDDHLRVDHPVRDHHSFVAAGTGSCSRHRGRRHCTDPRGDDPFRIHQRTRDHSALHGSAHRSAVALTMSSPGGSPFCGPELWRSTYSKES